MDQDLDDDFFDDDIDLDHLPANTLDELEERAFLSTQVNLHAPDVGANSEDYGLEDEDVVDLDAPQDNARNNYAIPPIKPADEVTQREHWRLQRYAATDKQELPNDQWTTARAGVTSWNGAAEPSQSGPLYNPGHDAPVIPGSDLDVSALQARILELERDRTVLQKSAEDAKLAALSKAGEIAIVRANHEKTTKEYERRMAAIQQSHSEEIAKQKCELEASRRDREKIETSNRFLEHDLAQEAERARNMKKTLAVGHGNATKGRMPLQPSPLSTPRKDRHLPFRDGFDDDEVVMISPSKPKGNSRPVTPRGGTKRKRALTAEQSQSPGQMLPLMEPAPLPQEESYADSSTTHNPGPELPTQLSAAEENLKLMQTILDHRSGPSWARTVEAMTHYSLPSNPSKSLSSVIYDHVVLVSSSQSVEDFRLAFCDVLINLWSKCLGEKYFAPLHEIVELLQYMLTISPSILSNTLIPRIVPLCFATADTVALPTAKASKTKSLLEAPSSELKEQIDPLDYLNFLHQLVLDCYPRNDLLIQFWTAMEFDFVLLMLHKAQPLAQINQMLQLLATSILPTSFGAISTRPPPQQMKNESDMIDRLTVLLFETPQPPTDESPYSPLDIANLRTSVLTLIQSLAYTTYGGNLLATHRLAIGRFVRFLHEAILTLYTYRPATHAATTTHVNATVYILAHLTSNHSEVVDIRAKLATIPSGPQKHLASLSRVAFAEGYSVLEKGIESEAAEAAHRMLDELLSPEEGDAVVDVFSSAR